LLAAEIGTLVIDSRLHSKACYPSRAGENAMMIVIAVRQIVMADDPHTASETV